MSVEGGSGMVDEGVLPFLSPGLIDVDTAVARLVPYEEAKLLQCLPFRAGRDTDGNIYSLDVVLPISSVGAAFDPRTRDRLMRRTHAEQVTFFSGDDGTVLSLIDRTYLGIGSESTLEVDSFEGSDSGVDQPAGNVFATGVGDTPATESGSQILLDSVLAASIVERGTDIHFEFHEQKQATVIRIRVDGALRDLRTIYQGPELHKQLINVVKGAADLDTTSRNRAQDGRFSHEHDGRRIEMRVATTPTVDGTEGAVLRVLDASTAPTNLSSLGFSGTELSRYRSLYQRLNGLVLVTGSTGSGKTTTLRATLEDVMTPEMHVVTVEDPVEHRIDGVTQIQINSATGLTWTSSLRNILRMDPDVILIGEIRDRESAQIAVEASLTGHLVLTTLHTRTAPGAITRLLEMGVEPYLVTSAVTGVLTQRLIRKVCVECTEPDTDAWKIAEGLAVGVPEVASFRRGAGCPACSHSGYRGRVGIHASVVMDDNLRKAITNEEASELALARAATEGGWRPLWRDAFDKACAGATSIGEVIKSRD